MSQINFQDVNLHKREEVARKRAQQPIDALHAKSRTRRPSLSLAAALARPGVSLIAEVKRQSLAKQVYRAESSFNPYELARIYAGNGAVAVSVLADELFFGGDSKLVKEVDAAVGGVIPVIYKDFIVDPYQVAEAHAQGADAVLIIARPPVDTVALRESIQHARTLGMDAMVEIFTAEGAREALAAGATIIGINNREYPTFTIDFERFARIRATLPADILTVSETGLKSPDDVRRAGELGFNAVLIGEAILTAPDVAGKVRELSRAGRTVEIETATHLQ